jgi:hypothetical protein
MGRSPIGNKGLGITMVKGFNLTPFPPANMTAIIS